MCVENLVWLLNQGHKEEAKPVIARLYGEEQVQKVLKLYKYLLNLIRVLFIKLAVWFPINRRIWFAVKFITILVHDHLEVF
ncbi:hypothetical protein PF005_g27782 [Phytophthora fragariae]|uniref:Uncharacterized protein n=2 Tax=Phytophthora TaxID=4783 RepID=A0A6A3W0Z5_9STRA|nr:hypothetical protein PF003_g19131 [Phytophthora fragariae]KAE8971960.1 hypothetical protein PR002_g26660 [Phytophthora rubi]KAE8921368.1 hypothetical protein PF009_g28350 [Phytophthora fragariae]KAE8969252.1 hypothetical protein PF011_g26876 [Phytophthora fragariae]KAE9067924.1 hypothetical protein PF010_g27273 [Phytophthora fragariae]